MRIIRARTTSPEDCGGPFDAIAGALHWVTAGEPGAVDLKADGNQP